MLLNIDLGETSAEPDELYACAHLANLACGGHAGDERSMRRALELCLAHAAQPGAHPSFPDREGFGRVELPMTPGALREAIRRQCAALASAAREVGARLDHVKAHGALYHAISRDRALAVAFVDGALDGVGAPFAVLGPEGSALAAVAAERGLPFAREGFADRGARADGTLVPRGEPGALLVDPVEVAARARHLRRSGRFETICVHGDTPGAVGLARAARGALDGPLDTSR